MARFLESFRALAKFFLTGDTPSLVARLSVIIAADYLTAVLCAVLGKARHGRRLSSRIGFLGILRKSLIFICPTAVKAFAINEAISVLQNVALLGTWIPPGLRNGLGKVVRWGKNDIRGS